MTKVRKTCTLAFKLELIKLIEEQGKKISDVCSGQLILEVVLKKLCHSHKLSNKTGMTPCKTLTLTKP